MACGVFADSQSLVPYPCIHPIPEGLYPDASASALGTCMAEETDQQEKEQRTTATKSIHSYHNINYMDRNNDLSGKIFAITGGASGIGLAASKILLSRGASVAVADVDDAALEHSMNTLRPVERLQFNHVDVSKRDSVDTWIETVVARFGRLDGAANCAGVIGKHHGTRNVEALDDGQWDLIIGVNLTGELLCCSNYTGRLILLY